MAAQTVSHDNETHEAPGGAMWRDAMQHTMEQSGGSLTLSNVATPMLASPYSLFASDGLPTISEPPQGWSAVTYYRVTLMSALGVPLETLPGQGSVKLEIRRAISNASPVAEVALSGYSQAAGFVGVLPDLRTISGPLQLTLMFLDALPLVGAAQVLLQYGRFSEAY